MTPLMPTHMGIIGIYAKGWIGNLKQLTLGRMGATT